VKGMGSIYRRGGTWWVKYYVRGRCVRKSTGCTERGDALRFLRQQQAEIAQGRQPAPDPARVTFEDLCELLMNDYRVNARKSLVRAQASIKRLQTYFRGQKALDITPDRMQAYIAARLRSAAKPATIQKERAALVRMFTLAVASGRLALRPTFPTIEVRNVRSGFFEEPELRRVVANLPGHVVPVVLFAYFTGWRKSEVLGLRWHQIDFAAGTVRLEPGTTKNDEGRMFPFGEFPELHELLVRQRAATEALQRASGRIVPHVFHRRGGPIRGFRRAWVAACRRAGVVRLFHDLRRTAVRNLERHGVPRSWAMRLTGHKTEAVYRRYAIVSERDLREAVQRLAAGRMGTILGTTGHTAEGKLGWMTGFEPATTGATVQCSTS
jgi:integrase